MLDFELDFYINITVVDCSLSTISYLNKYMLNEFGGKMYNIYKIYDSNLGHHKKNV